MVYILPTMTKGKSPEDRQELLKQLCEKSFGKSWGQDIYQQSFAWLEGTDFFSAPASTKYHGAYGGGLFDHSMNVAKVLLWMTNDKAICTWQRTESPVFIGILHDVTKIGRYTLSQDMNPNTGEMEPIYLYNKDKKSESPIHGEDSVLIVSQHALMTPEERNCIRFHMGAYETEDWKQYDIAIKHYPNVLWTHTADMIASKLMEGGVLR